MIDPYNDWTTHEQPPLFTEDDIIDLEEASNAGEGGGFGFTLDDIEDKDDEESNKESLPMPEGATSRMESKSHTSAKMPSEEAQSLTAQGSTSRTRRCSASPFFACRAGKRKM